MLVNHNNELRMINKPYSLIKLVFSTSLLLVTVLISSCSDDEDQGLPPTMVSFAQESYTMAENNNNGVEVAVDFAETARVEGDFTITVSVENGAYGTDFRTDPDGESGTISYQIRVAENEKSIKVIPTDDVNYTGDVIVTLALTAGNNTVVGQQGTATVTITDNESEPALIADIRAMHNGSNVTIDNNSLIEAVVISEPEAMAENHIVLHDNSGGLFITLDGPHSYPRGALLRVNLFGGTLTSTEGLLSLEGVALDNIAQISLGTELPEVQAITLDQLASGDFQGLLVSIEDVYFVDDDGLDSLSGVHEISNGTVEASVKVEPGAPFAGDIIPLGRGAISGIAGGNQIWPQMSSDIFQDNPTSFIATAGELSQFEAAPETSSDSQSFTVEGTDLTSDIDITATEGFEVSLDDTEFASSVVVPMDDANAGPVQVFVRFTPAAGSSGIVEGDIVISSQGAATVNMEVTGEVL